MVKCGSVWRMVVVPDTPQVALRRICAPEEDLWAHVERAAKKRVHLWKLLARKPKVGDLELRSGGLLHEDEVLGLEVAVHNAIVVEEVEAGSCE